MPLLSNLIPANSKNAGRSKQLKSNMMENEYFQAFYDEFSDIAMTLFEWKNLPESCDERFLEETLFNKGTACFVRNTLNENIYSLSYRGHDKFDMYGYPLKYEIYGHAQDSTLPPPLDKSVEKENVVIVDNNLIKKSTQDIIFYHASRLANLAITIDVNVNAMKTPILIETDEENKMTARNIYHKYNGNEPVVFVKKGHYADKQEIIRVLKTDAPFVADKLLALQHDIKNDVLTIMGVNNSEQDKKERMVTDEVNSNLDEIFIHALSMYTGRKKAADEVNKRWGTNIEVVFRKQENDDLLKFFGMLEEMVDEEESKTFEEPEYKGVI